MRKLVLASIIASLSTTIAAAPAAAQGALHRNVLPPCCSTHQPMQDTPFAVTRLNMAALYRDVRAADSTVQLTGRRITTTRAQAVGICRQFRSAVYEHQGFNPFRQIVATAYAIAALGPRGIYFAPMLTSDQLKVRDPQDHAILARCSDIRRSTDVVVTLY